MIELQPFKALVVRQDEEKKVTHALETVTLNDLAPGEVIIKVAYSSVNFKDSLAVKAGVGVIRNYPMIPGIDLSGTVVASDDVRFKEGQSVLVTGFKVGMSHTGGFSQYARIPADWVVPLPDGLSLREAMVIGTAGFTAALSIMALESKGMKVENQPNILVVGASGGVGSTAVQLLAASGYKNICGLTRKKEEETELLLNLGAASVIGADEVVPEKPALLGKTKFDFVLDTVGGPLAAALVPQISYGGSMTMCGNAGGVAFDTNVLPFILRGISVLGIDSVERPMDDRPQIWSRFAAEWSIMAKSIVNETNLEGLSAVFDSLQSGTHVGRTIVKID